MSASLARPPQYTSGEQQSIKTLADYGKRYRNRVCLKLSEDLYHFGLLSYLSTTATRYARVPFRTVDEVYYFFENSEDLDRVLRQIAYMRRAAKGTPALLDPR